MALFLEYSGLHFGDKWPSTRIIFNSARSSPVAKLKLRSVCYNQAMMDKYDLTQEQWDEKVTAKLKEIEKALDDGTAEFVPYEEARARIMKRIEEAAEKERAKTALSFETSYTYESDSVTV
jgi:predicted transcriptional regulator